MGFVIILFVAMLLFKPEFKWFIFIGFLDILLIIGAFAIHPFLGVALIGSQLCLGLFL